MNKKILSALLAAVMLLGTLSVLGGCGQKNARPDALVIMTDALDGVFNPFYSTTAPDSTIVSMTQIAMLTTGYENGQVTVACGEDEAVVALTQARHHAEQDTLFSKQDHYGYTVPLFCLVGGEKEVSDSVDTPLDGYRVSLSRSDFDPIRHRNDFQALLKQ